MVDFNAEDLGLQERLCSYFTCKGVFAFAIIIKVYGKGKWHDLFSNLIIL